MTPVERDLAAEAGALGCDTIMTGRDTLTASIGGATQCLSAPPPYVSGKFFCCDGLTDGIQRRDERVRCIHEPEWPRHRHFGWRGYAQLAGWHCQLDGDRSEYVVGRFSADRHSALPLTHATVIMKRPKALMPGLLLAASLSCGGDPTATPVSPPVTPPAQQEIPISGAAVTGLGPFDQSVRDLMRKYALPGGAVALVRDGKLIYARGFGYADVENKTPVQPDALFRIASISKSLTSAAIMKLVEEGKLDLDDRVAPLIAHLAPAPGATVDPRWEQITIRNLLNHTGGWDRAKPNGGFDPMDRPAIAAAAVGAPAPASAETIIRYMRGMPLDFNPGEKFAYSNFGYTILGRVIERLSGMPYEQYVRARVLQPVGANRTRSGKTRMDDALADEVKYYFAGAGLNSPLVPSVFPGEGAVPANYGGYYLEAKDAEGGWVSSTIDLLRFVNGVDGRASPPDILSPQLVAQMTGSGVTVCPDGSCYYAAGWFVRPTQGDATWWHGGDLPGTKSFLVRSSTNVSWVALFNAGTPANLPGELDAALWSALGKITTFPTHDLFSTFP